MRPPAGTAFTPRSLRNAVEANRKSRRLRGVDPATSDVHYSADEWEFLQAMQAYKASSGRPFPTWSEALRVLRGLGYEKKPEPVTEAREAS